MGVVLESLFPFLIPRIGDGKSWELMPVREAEGKTQATAPYGYACDDGTIGLLLEDGNDLGCEMLGWRG